MGTAYRLADDLILRFNALYDIKNQKASVEAIAPTTPDDRAAILRNQQIHHRDEVYRGFSDSSFLISRQCFGVLSDDDHLVVSLGTSIPIGKTEDDPWKLGNAGQKHLHIQFGSGTFNPLLGLNYSTPVTGRTSVAATAHGSFPFYENSKTYRHSVELSGRTEVRYRVNAWMALHVGYSGLVQSYAHWDGEQDKNSGLISHLATIGISIDAADHVLLHIDGLIPFHGQTLVESSGTFEQNQTLSVTTAYSF